MCDGDERIKGLTQFAVFCCDITESTAAGYCCDTELKCKQPDIDWRSFTAAAVHISQ
jgi:hypothetical protein